MNRLLPSLLALATAAVLLTAAPQAEAAKKAPTAATQVSEAKGARLTKLYADYWEEVLKLNPIQATFQGDNRYNDLLPDFGSAEYRREQHEFTERWLKTIEGVGSDGLSGQDLLSYEIFVRDSKNSLEGERFPDWMMPINQMASIASYAVMLGAGTSAQPFKTVKDYDNWLARGNKLPQLFDTDIAN